MLTYYRQKQFRSIFKMSRVLSKHLFNFPLNGIVDEDLAEEEKKVDMAVVEMMIKTGGMAMEHELKGTHDSKSNLEYANVFRKGCEGLFTAQANHPLLIKAKEECIEIHLQNKLGFENSIQGRG